MKPPEALRHLRVLIKQRTERDGESVLTSEQRHARLCCDLSIQSLTLASADWIEFSLRIVFFNAFFKVSSAAVFFCRSANVTHWEFGSICAGLTHFSPRPHPTVSCPKHMCRCRGISDPRHTQTWHWTPLLSALFPQHMSGAGLAFSIHSSRWSSSAVALKTKSVLSGR